MASKYNCILLFGAPGSGKGLQGKILNSIPGLFHCSMGDVFRSLDKNSELGKAFVQYSSVGKLVPDELTLKIWADFMEKQVNAGRFNPAEDMVVFDGFPRTVDQAVTMQEQVRILKILHLNCADQNILIKRIQGRALIEKRTDDAKTDVIRNRMEVYERETSPVLKQFLSNQVVTIDASLTPMEVLSCILQVLVSLKK
ncbi:MAG: nucleoside monophosphate kinase [Candidatus Aureabacteria bacterium]|nr:nucleoside monophosphate kinase [Candidatus Auribacterota bacterium]